MLSVFKKNDFQPAPDSEEGKFFAEWQEVQDELAHLFAEGAAAKQSNGLTNEVQSDTVQAGQAKNMARSKYIQKHDDADFGYRIISQLTSAQYKRRKELGQYACDLSSGNAGGGVVLADYRELDKKRNTLTERSTYDNSPVPNTGGNAGVQLVGSRSSQQQGGSPISGVRIDGRSERHTSGSADSGVPTRQGVKKDTGNSGVSSYAKNSLRSVEIDKQYLDAVNRGDMEAARKMVDEAAKKADDLTIENTPAEAADTIFMTLQTN